jgi:hypothetical protein
LGISYAYLDRKKEALEAFDMLLSIQPGHALSYTLSPKVTFLFEEARRLSAARQPPTVDLSWPRNLKVTDPVPVDVEVVSDPKGLMKTAVLHTRLKGALEYVDQAVTLAGPQRYHRIDLAPVAVPSNGPETLQLYLTVTDGRGNQVHLLGDPDHPREVSLAFEEPEPWYRKWWLWTAVGAVLAAGTGTAVYFLLREPPATVGGTFHVP